MRLSSRRRAAEQLGNAQAGGDLDGDGYGDLIGGEPESSSCRGSIDDRAGPLLIDGKTGYNAFKVRSSRYCQTSMAAGEMT